MKGCRVQDSWAYVPPLELEGTPRVPDPYKGDPLWDPLQAPSIPQKIHAPICRNPFKEVRDHVKGPLNILNIYLSKYHRL